MSKEEEEEASRLTDAKEKARKGGNRDGEGQAQRLLK